MSVLVTVRFGEDGTAKTDYFLVLSIWIFILFLVSELRKRFEGITTSASDWEMNR